jgi:ADP-heptose:LPS heptosyltransferase
MTPSPEKLVADFLSEYQLSKTYSRSRISTLAELAVSEDPSVAASATTALFKSLIERLADSFDPENVSLYNRVFSQLTESLRRDARAKPLDSELTNFALNCEEHMLARAEGLRQIQKLDRLHNWNQTLKCVLVLSRVTLGADVAITSVILERMKLLLPSAEIILLGGSKSAELLGGDSRVRLEEIRYRRGGTIIERLLAWAELVKQVRSITKDMNGCEYLIIDPDTRLTQLGLLPLVNRADSQVHSDYDHRPNYLFFPSREYGHKTALSLAELTTAWLDEVFGESEPICPRVSLNQIDVESARTLTSQLRAQAGRRVVAINFGIGGNAVKSVGENFEASLVCRFISEGFAIVFDKGAGDEEAGRAEAALAEATRIERNCSPARLLEINERNLSDALSSEYLDADILVWNGRVGLLAALIGESDLYIGYDSAGQHIAAAIGVPCIDIFAGASSQRMLDRWKPTGTGETRVLPVNTRAGFRDATDLSSQVFRVANELLALNRVRHQ